jgi:hypothetical protein
MQFLVWMLPRLLTVLTLTLMYCFAWHISYPPVLIYRSIIHESVNLLMDRSLLLTLAGAALLVLNASPTIQAAPPATNPATAPMGMVTLDASPAPTQTWTQDTRADWEAGTLEFLDSAGIPGSLQLAQRHFSVPSSLIPPTHLSSYQRDPDIAVDDAGNAYVVWTDDREGDKNIYFAHRPAGGTWGPSSKVNDDAGTAPQSHPAIAVDGNGNAYAVWQDARDGSPNIYFAYQPSGGTWKTNEQVNDDPHDAIYARSPDIAVDVNGNAYAVWKEREDIYSAYRPAGGAWGTRTKVNDYGTVARITSPLKADSSLLITPSPTPNPSPTPTPNPTPIPGQEYAPAIDVDNKGNGYAVWADSREGSFDVYFALGSAGDGWEPNVRVNGTPGPVRGWPSPAIAVDGSGNAYAIWEQPFTNRDLYFAYRPVGSVWGTSEKVNDSTGTVQRSPAIAVDGNGNAYAVWTDNRDGENALYWAYRPADGGWGSDARVTDYASIASQSIPTSQGNNTLVPSATPAPTSAPVQQYNPAITLDGSGNAYIVWENYIDNVDDILFAYSLQSYQPLGVFTSPVLDTGMITATWESLSHISSIPAGTSLFFETRSLVSGKDPLTSPEWSAWQPIIPVSRTLQISSPPGRYLQYRATFSTTLSNTTPVLDQVRIVYRWAGAPSAPHLSTPCGVTNQTRPTLTGSAAEGSVVHLYVDGTEVTTQTVSPGTLSCGSFAFKPHLTWGHHTLTVTAENENGTGPASLPLTLIVNPTMTYDPIDVRAGEWTEAGWQPGIPRDNNGCANPTNGWRVWPRPDQPFRVQIPISYTTSAAVTVTLGTQTLALTETESTGLFAGLFQPPIQSGDFSIQIEADGDTTTVTGGPVLIDPDGVVYEATGTLSNTIPGVTVTCYYSDAYRGQWRIWDAWTFQQINPQITSDDGYYSFYTPRGTYRVVAEKTGYPTHTSPDLVVVSTPVRYNIPLGWHRIYLPLLESAVPRAADHEMGTWAVPRQRPARAAHDQGG